MANNKQPIESAVHNVANKYIILPICNLHASYFTSISPPLCLSVDVVVSRPTVYKKFTIVLRFWYDKITGNKLAHTYSISMATIELQPPPRRRERVDKGVGHNNRLLIPLVTN